MIVYKLDRFSRNLSQLINLLEDLHNKEVAFISINESLDLMTPNGKLPFHIIAAFSEFKREVIRERIKSGVIAKQQKIKIGQDTWRGRGPYKEKRKPRSDRGLKRGKYNLKKLGT